MSRYFFVAMKITGKQTLAFFWKHIWNLKGTATILMVSITCAVTFEMVIPIFFMKIFDVMLGTSADDVAGVLPLIFQYFAIMVALDLGMNVFWRINEFNMDSFQPKILKNIATEAFEYLQYHSYRFFSNQFSGSLVRKVSRLVWSFNKFIDRVYWEVSSLLVRIVLTIAILWWINAWVGVVVLVWTVIYFFASLWISKWKYQFDVEASRRESMISANLGDVITNILNVQLFTSHKSESRRFEANAESWRAAIKRSWRIGTYINLGQSIFMLLLELGLLYLAIRLWSLSLVTAGFLFLLHNYIWGLMWRLWDLRRMMQTIFESFADAEEMIAILRTPHEVTDAPGAKKLKLSAGKIDFHQVTFGYEDHQSILKEFELTIQPGQKVAFVGHSGEGKTTLTKLLMRFFDIQSGEILIDGQNIARVTLDSLRRSISLVPQDPVLFHRTLLENIAYGKKDATTDEVIRAANLANCHDFIMKTPKQYDTLVGERGIKLSGGERQRIAIARAILENAPIVILDEATSSLDSHSERLIQEALHHLLKGKTAIMIAHRLSTIMEADRILVIEDGKVVEEGTHQQLLERPEGVYRHLWEIQAGGFLGE
ncbi:MAG: ABC transporter ATP-binding protein [bacterium]|nr:ABC transporter ATP-binding protein [bacterium]